MSELNDEQLFERRHGFLSQRMAGATFSAIKALYDRKQRDLGSDQTISVAQIRKDVDRAKQELIDGATRDALRGDHRAILLDMRRANYAAMAGGDVDAAKVIMSTLVREAEMFGLDDPKRSVIGVGTDVEFANDLVGLIEAVGFQAPADLKFAARGELTEPSRDESRDVLVQPTTIDVEVVDDPEPENPFLAIKRESATTPDPVPPTAEAWSNL